MYNLTLALVTGCPLVPLTWNLSAFESGLMLLPFSAGYFVASLSVNALQNRIGTRANLVLGMLLVSIGNAILSTSYDHSFPYALLALLVVGWGLGMAIAPSTGIVTDSVPVAYAGEASGVSNVFRYLGGSLGVATASMIYSLLSHARLNELLATLGLSAQRIESLDPLLTGMAQSAPILASFSQSEQKVLLKDVDNALALGFEAAILFIALTALLAAFLFFVLLRSKKAHKGSKT